MTTTQGATLFIVFGIIALLLAALPGLMLTTAKEPMPASIAFVLAGILGSTAATLWLASWAWSRCFWHIGLGNL